MKNRFAPPKVGDRVAFRKTMTVAEQAMFTGISGNLGGAYVDRGAAQAAGLSDMAVFELAAASLASTCLARLAGPGHRIARFDMRFAGAVCVGTTIEAAATLTAAAGDALTFALTLRVDATEIGGGEAELVALQSGGA